MNAENDLSRWLKAQLFKERKDKLVKFVLRHAAPGAKGNEVDDFEIPESLDIDSLPSFVDDILARAQMDANGLGPDVHRYVLHAITDAKEGARFAFRIRGETEDYEENGGDNPANMRGLLQQFMRHNEAYARTMTQGMQSIVMTMSRNIESRDGLVEKLMQERIDNQIKIEEAKSQESEREIQLLLASGNEDRKNKVFEKIEMLMPIVLNKIAGKPILEEKEQSVLKGFLDTLTKDQFGKILSALTSEQQVALLTAVKSIQETEAKKESQKKLTNGAS